MNLKPWREVATPHPDVAEGRYLQAEFVANLAAVVEGKAEWEYSDGAEFFRRTYLTDGMRRLLVESVKRLAGKGGEPVIQLKTVFGGGKTHTMLALYHLVSGKTPVDRMPGVREVLEEAGVRDLPAAKPVVFVGTTPNPTRSRSVNGVEVRTLWGDLAAQMGGKEAFAFVEAADKKGVAPGSDDLGGLFNLYGPVVLLIDEFVAYARNLYGKTGLAGGSFDSNLTFLHSLTEAVNHARNCVLVASIPESEIEYGSDEDEGAGLKAKERIEHIFERIDSVWKPVGALEGFEIVRRRLFNPIQDESAREETCRAFAQLYESSPSDFPPESRQGNYLERLRNAYPIHPELFDQLYNTWSASIERFQRTRGVLRLMAAVIHALWQENDRSFLILPGTLPLDSPTVRNELLRYLSEAWNAVVDKDIDGATAEPSKIDSENPRFGAIQAARRVARTVFLATAPHGPQVSNRGVEDVRVTLGAVQPGESVADFNDALRRMSDRLTHLYSGNRRYWYDTQPNLLRTKEERAARLQWETVGEEIIRRLRQIRERGEFSGVHVCAPSGDIADDLKTRLVILPPSVSHRANRRDSSALAAARETLEKRGNSPRIYKNTLLFVAADEDAIAHLERDVRDALAWKSILDERLILNLDAHQQQEVERGQKRSEESLNTRLNDAYGWLLVPTQEGMNPPDFETIRISGGQESPVVKASKKAKSSEYLITAWSPALLRMELDRWLWKEESHVSVKRVWECLATYLYFPRLRDEQVFLATLREGVKSREYFGYATSIGTDGRYQGLQFGGDGGSIYLDAQSVLVKPESAGRQLLADSLATTGAERPVLTVNEGHSAVGFAAASSTAFDAGVVSPPLDAIPVQTPRTPKRFYGTVELDGARLPRDVGKIADEILQHLAALVGSQIRVTLEIGASIPNGVPENVRRIISENCVTLKVKHDFPTDE